MSLSLRRIFVLPLLLALFGLLFFASAVYAVAKGYNSADTGIQPGMVVALTASDEEEPLVERASPDNIGRVIGIVVNPSDTLAALGSDRSQVFVESTGEAEGYVTDMNGEVMEGDRLTVSPLRGLLMRADADDPGAAVALEGFGDKPEDVEVSTDGGEPGKVHLLKLSLNMTSSGGSGDNQSTLASLGESIVDKDVTELQVIIALIIFFIMLVTEGAIIYAAISSGIISLGRNPLAEGLIHREIARMVGIAMFVLCIGLAAIYAILWI